MLIIPLIIENLMKERGKVVQLVSDKEKLETRGRCRDGKKEVIFMHRDITTEILLTRRHTHRHTHTGSSRDMWPGVGKEDNDVVGKPLTSDKTAQGEHGDEKWQDMGKERGKRRQTARERNRKSHHREGRNDEKI